MELHGVHKTFYPNPHGEEKQQMLNLNRRLETYLSRVKLLEEENEMLANEIKVLSHNNLGKLTHRRGLEEELRQARLEVDAAWRERVLTEVEVQKLTEEFQALELQRQREAEAKMLAKTKMEQSRKELENEQRAQIWLREKVNQLEHEMRFLIQTHEEDVAHLEATLTQSTTKTLPTLIQRSKQTPDLLRMGHEFSQRATRAWQEAAEAYQGQLAQLEETLDQARSRLSHVCQEKRESQLKLQSLEKEIASAKDVRLHLEKTVAQRGEEHSQEIQQLREHLEELEVEKVELGQEINNLLQENRSLMQMKMSLGLEVATYRALLDGESLGRDAALLNKPRNISVRDAVWSPHGVQKNYPTQMSAGLKTTHPSSIQGRTGLTITTTQMSREPLKISGKHTETSAVKSTNLESTYPKIVQNGAAENFRPEEVYEKVTYAEPLLAPNERKTPEKMSEDEDKTVAEAGMESAVSHRTELGLSREPLLNEKAAELCNVRLAELPCEHVKDMTFEGESEEENVHPRARVDSLAEVEHVCREAQHVQGETSDSETEAMLESSFESRPSSPESESQPQESDLNQVTDIRIDESNSNVYVANVRQEITVPNMETNRREDEDRLYPDGEEMDTWDSVIERKAPGRIDDGVNNEGNKQHAEPEEDISAKELEENKMVSQLGNMGSVLPQVDEGNHTKSEQEHVPSPEKEDGDDEEDSQNVSVSWRTELESDSYAQDNTLADTRPLIRYKSDDTDANTQASHFDESESSEGEQEKKVGDAGMGTWNEGKPKTFGTMEDLCEEVEEEAIDDDYNLGYTHVVDRDVDQGVEVCEYILVNHGENVEGVAMSGNEGLSEEETEELTGATVHTIDYEDELETDRLVEQELENLSTDSYSAHFAHKQVGGNTLDLEQKSVKEIHEQQHTHANLTCEPEIIVNYEVPLSAAVTEEASGGQQSRDQFVEMHSTKTLTEEAVKKQEEMENLTGDCLSDAEMNVNSESGAFTTIPGDALDGQQFSVPFVIMHSTKTLTEGGVNEQEEMENPEAGSSSEPKMNENSESGSFTKILRDALDGQHFRDPFVEMPLTKHLTEVAATEQEATKNPTGGSFSDAEMNVNSESGQFTTITREGKQFSDPFVNIHSTKTLMEEGVKEQEEMENPTAGSSSESKINENSEFQLLTTILGDTSETQEFRATSVEMHSAKTLTQVVVKEQKETVKATADQYSCEPEMSVNHEQVPSPISTNNTVERQLFGEAYIEMHSKNTLTDEAFQLNDQETVVSAETTKEDDLNVMSHADGAENSSGLTDFFSRSFTEDIYNIQATADLKLPQDTDTPTKDDLPEETPTVFQKHFIEDAENLHKCSEDGETAEWENLENTAKKSETSDGNEHDPRNNITPELSDDDIIIHQEQPVDISSVNALNENDLFIVKDVTYSGLHSHFTSDDKNDYWVSSSETGATCDAYNEAAGHPGHNADNKDREDLDNTKVVNGNSRLDIDSSSLDPMTRPEQIITGVRKAFCRKAGEGETVHSEESDAEAESWSSGEETA